jgi:hypothetical protein
MRTPKRAKNHDADDSDDIYAAKELAWIEEQRKRLGPQPPPPPPKEKSDEDLATEFLAGWVRESGGRVSYGYLEPGSDRERDTQAALVRLLRSGEPSNVFASGLRRCLIPRIPPRRVSST